MNLLNVRLEIIPIRRRIIPMKRHEIDRARGAVPHELSQPRDSHGTSAIRDCRRPELDLACVGLHPFLVGGCGCRRGHV